MLAPFACSDTGSRTPMRYTFAALSCAASRAEARASTAVRKTRRDVICHHYNSVSMAASSSRAIPSSIDETQALLGAGDYVADRSLATSLFLSLAMKRPLFLEGEAGVGKTEIAKVVSQALGRELIRLQCYEGLDISQAAYEWNYSRQMVEIRLAEAAGEKDKQKLGSQIYTDEFLVKRPLARALEGDSPVLLIDELDRTDEPFE